ncbi:MAG TPA: DUF4038 domain-containing protein [Bacteroidota bacterium]|nr:DUF4038 domain-containing protein [Bacteroidota bacterium]
MKELRLLPKGRGIASCSFQFLVLVISALLLWGPPPACSQLLSVDTSNRFLVTQTGKPYLLIGNAAWSLIAQLSDSDADYYLANRHSMGFNGVLVNLLEHQFSTNAPNDYYNIPPFTGTAFSSAPNDSYFAHVDHILNSAAAQGIVVWLDALYLGYACGGQGWCAEVQAASAADMTSYGNYIGKRYASFPNIVWVIGGDTDPTPVLSKVQAMVNGILQYDSTHLFTAHNNQEQMAVTPWNGASWLNVNDVYTYTNNLYASCNTAYNYTPRMPFFLIEAAYENEHSSTEQQLRSQSYWTILSGGFGHMFGNCPIWHFDGDASQSFCTVTGWKGQLSNQGSWNMKYLHDLMNSRRWYKFVPDTKHVAVTSGYGSSTSYVTTAYCSDSSSIISYLPGNASITVNMNLIGGSAAAAWWYNPASGVATRIARYAHGTHTFTPTASGDWVLVVDNNDIYPDSTAPISAVKIEEKTTNAAEGVFPNPFRTTLNILTMSALPVEVYDILGRRVFTGRTAPGRSTFAWTPHGLSYGMYFVRLGLSAKLFKVLYVP